MSYFLKENKFYVHVKRARLELSDTEGVSYTQVDYEVRGVVSPGQVTHGLVHLSVVFGGGKIKTSKLSALSSLSCHTVILSLA